MSRINVDKITGATGTASGAPITLSGDTATLSGTGVTFPSGHIISFATGTLTRSSDLTISDGTDYHLTDLSCDLVTTSTSNKIVVQYIIPDIYNLNSSGNAAHCGVRYNVGTGAFDNSAAQTLGAKSYPASYVGYQAGNYYSAALTTAFVMVTATVPTVNTLRLYPILNGTGGGVHIFDNASTSTFDEASIIAYEIKQ